MTDTIISFETAKSANLKGFDPNVKLKKNSHYNSNTEVLDNLVVQGSMVNYHYYAATQSLLKKWLREEYKISIKIDDFYTDSRIRYDYNVCKLGSQDDNPEGIFVTYEEALEKALQKALNMI